VGISSFISDLDDACEKLMGVHLYLLGLALLVFVCGGTCGMLTDLDHIPSYLLGIQVPAWSDILGYGGGRPLHSIIGVWGGLSCACCSGLLALMVLIILAGKKV
jgi:hypothetical protein